MQQISQFVAGERDYTLIKGGTGPLVYPAAHVYIYTLLYTATDGGKNILLAQTIFAWLYLGILALVMACYRMAKVSAILCAQNDLVDKSTSKLTAGSPYQAPPYLFPLLILSKRLHSIFLLRLFNDCFVVGFLFIAIYAYQHRIWTIGSVAYSFAIGTKMTAVLAAPAVGAVLLQALSLRRALNAAFLMLQVQLTIAWQFLPTNPLGYVSRAFEFSRKFLYKWTVNWRFVEEETFVSNQFALVLAITNLGLLSWFFATRWLKPSNRSLPAFISLLFKPPTVLVQQKTSLRVSPLFIMTSILSSMAIGLLCARSLHYQFYAYIAWSTPFLLWRSGIHPIGIYAVWAAQEWAWNVYPSTTTSSKFVVGCLAIQVFGVCWGFQDDMANEEDFVR